MHLIWYHNNMKSRNCIFQLYLLPLTCPRVTPLTPGIISTPFCLVVADTKQSYLLSLFSVNKYWVLLHFPWPWVFLWMSIGFLLHFPWPIHWFLDASYYDSLSSTLQFPNYMQWKKWKGVHLCIIPKDIFWDIYSLDYHIMILEF